MNLRSFVAGGEYGASRRWRAVPEHVAAPNFRVVPKQERAYAGRRHATLPLPEFRQHGKAATLRTLNWEL
jgi:hypothetical protein